jgi:hypothetical protein
MEEEYNFNTNLDIDDMYLLYDCVKRRLENWNGNSTNHPAEKEKLEYLKNELYRAILDYKFHNV